MQGVEFQSVAKRFGAVSVIEGMNLTIEHGEFMVLVGPSGCGKSTALRMIAGLEAITEGSVTIGGRRVNELAPKDRDVAMVFQNYALYPHMTVRQNIEFGLKIRQVEASERTKLVNEAAAVLGIEKLLDRKPKELSGGQRQRVALGRAIVRKPSVFLFDEPLSNLDAKLRVQMRAELKKLQHRLGVTTVYVTHDQVEAMTMGSRIAVMKDGFLQQVGTPIDVYDRPMNVFVAQFIGTPPMNFLEGALSADGQTMTGPGFSLKVPAALHGATAGRGGSKVIIGIRPEHLQEGDAQANAFTVQVELVEPLGDHLVIHARVGEASLVFKLEPHRVVQLGQTLTVSVSSDALHIFDGQTEKRIVAKENA